MSPFPQSVAYSSTSPAVFPTVFPTYNVFEFVSTCNTNCLLGFPSNSVQGSMPNIFHESKTQTFRGTDKVQFFDCNISVTS